MSLFFDVNNYSVRHQRLDLAPRNIYLLNGRVVTRKQVDKALDNICKDSFSEKCSKYWKLGKEFCKNLFVKKEK